MTYDITALILFGLACYAMYICAKSIKEVMSPADVWTVMYMFILAGIMLFVAFMLLVMGGAR